MFSCSLFSAEPGADSKTLNLATLAPQMAQILKGLGLSGGDSKTLNLATLAPHRLKFCDSEKIKGLSHGGGGPETLSLATSCFEILTQLSDP